jgi:hypothetical protein
MELTEMFGGTLNIAILACFYTVFGALISYVFFHLFDDCDEEWKRTSVVYKLIDVGAELSLVGIIAYWTMTILRENPPLVPIRRSLDRDIDTYISGIFFAFAMFLFLDDLSAKIQFIYKIHLETPFVKIFPERWSIIKALVYSGKTNTKRTTS